MFDRRGRHLATPDLLDEESGLAVEYDGRLHLEGSRRRRDRDREELLRSVGIDTLVVLAGDLHDRDRLAARMRAARARATWLPRETRPWTVEPPPWWTSTRTVDERRALSDADRRRLLRHRTVV